MHPVDNIDLVIHTLNGLSTDYKEIFVALYSRETPTSYAELQLCHNTNSDSMVATTNASLSNRGQPQYRSHPHEQIVAPTTNSKLICQYYERPGHNAKKCYKIHCYPRKSRLRPLVNMAHHQPTMRKSSRILDTGASHHVTQDLQQMTLANTYSGQDQVMVGDGTSLKISRTGKT
ncbi:PREDICTED: uncharacterized protein LOC109337753 [Lupinus angustifolius]|uniref:uncharacterized protein LOC109337753 n=1 Tax=Lupinus angustifolius TaxID=3871 RepID=UPI00092EA981|nr:PREDICTED: uncharacterized protein LOC109337753 [Lupinus angustifolius]